jgi:diadenosine tetraphosphate (Ap4A) HIT family hydrolase
MLIYRRYGLAVMALDKIIGTVDGCLFCDIGKDPSRQIFSNELFYAQFDKFPITPGHAEVIPKRHVDSLFFLTDEEWTILKPTLEYTVSIIESTDLRELYEGFLEDPVNDKSAWLCREMLSKPYIQYAPDAYNFGNNDGEAAGRTIHHLHIHIIPRYFGDVPDPRGGIRYIIPEYANYKK